MENYKSQVDLLLSVLPEVTREECFAIHGGTAINLFVREMPRLSVDIDLTYIPIEDRTTSLNNINKALARIKVTIESVVSNTKVILKPRDLKIQVLNEQAQIKIEVNQGIRGIIEKTVNMPLCQTAQEAFDAFCEIQVVPIGQLYGGKICAALDRQHPRDLFDIKYLLENEGFTNEIKTGFIFGLLSSKRPVYEMLYPNLLDQRSALTNQFEGMADEPFSYKDFATTRNQLIKIIHESLTDEDKTFLVNFENSTPDWTVYDFKDFPAVQWKLQNIIKLKETNAEKHAAALKKLRKEFDVSV